MEKMFEKITWNQVEKKQVIKMMQKRKNRYVKQVDFGMLIIIFNEKKYTSLIKLS